MQVVGETAEKVTVCLQGVSQVLRITLFTVPYGSVICPCFSEVRFHQWPTIFTRAGAEIPRDMMGGIFEGLHVSCQPF